MRRRRRRGTATTGSVRTVRICTTPASGDLLVVVQKFLDGLLHKPQQVITLGNWVSYRASGSCEPLPEDMVEAGAKVTQDRGVYHQRCVRCCACRRCYSL